MGEDAKLRDRFAFNAELIDAHLERSLGSYRYVIERRDRLMERMRIGAFTLNLGTLLGALSIAGTKGALDLVRFLQPFELFLLSLLVGTVFAGLSISVANKRFHEDASDAATEMRDYQRMKARLSKPLDETAVVEFGEDIRSLSAHKVPEFSHSPWEFRFLSVSTSCWVVSLSIPIVNLAKAIDWTIKFPG